MGVFSKLKGIFYDEVVVEEDDEKEIEKVNKIVKREPKNEVNEVPKIEEVKYKTVDLDEDDTTDFTPDKEEKKTENTFNERDLFRSDRTFNIVEFNDDEEEKVPSRRNVLSEQNRTTRVEAPTLDVDKPKVFKPTPVISPIWGVLDKDYKKEEIIEKPLSNEAFASSITDYDNVRRKAYGSLEDQLEDTFNTSNKVTTDEVTAELEKELVEPKEEKEVMDTRTAKIEDLIGKIDEATDELDKTMSIEEAENNVKLKGFDDEDEEDQEQAISDKTLTDSTLEHDLFNLIDSMYDKEE